MIVEGIVSFGDKQKAEEAMTPIAKKLHMTIPDASRAIIEKWPR